jgi:hypothetical protein
MEQLELRAKLYQKKSKARKLLQEIPVIKDGNNSFDHYKYISEKNYKDICTALLMSCNLELKVSVVSVESIQGTPKQPIGARVVVENTLIDLETGYCESVNSTGDGIDKGDKGTYKAQTGAFKYYMANNFQITTGDDAEKHIKDIETPDNPENPTDPPGYTAPDLPDEPPQKVDFKREKLIKYVTDGAMKLDRTAEILNWAKVDKISEMDEAHLNGAKKSLDKESSEA